MDKKIKDLKNFKIWEKAQEKKVLKELKILIEVKEERLEILNQKYYENGHPNIDKLEELISDLKRWHKSKLNYWKQ